jgi:hypothetical protein
MFVMNESDAAVNNQQGQGFTFRRSWFLSCILLLLLLCPFKNQSDGDSSCRVTITTYDLVDLASKDVNVSDNNVSKEKMKMSEVCGVEVCCWRIFIRLFSKNFCTVFQEINWNLENLSYPPKSTVQHLPKEKKIWWRNQKSINGDHHIATWNIKGAWFS